MENRHGHDVTGHVSVLLDYFQFLIHSICQFQLEDIKPIQMKERL